MIGSSLMTEEEIITTHASISTSPKANINETKQLQVFPNKPLDQDQVHNSIFHMIFPFHELVSLQLLD